MGITSYDDVIANERYENIIFITIDQSIDHRTEEQMRKEYSKIYYCYKNTYPIKTSEH